MIVPLIRPAVRKTDHNELCRIARTKKCCSSFSSIMFSNEAAYQKGWIRVAVDGDKIVGFTCVRHKVRAPETMLYYIVIDPAARRSGVGFRLLDDLYRQSPTGKIVLSCEKSNAEALAFYAKNGFNAVGEALAGKAIKFEKVIDKEQYPCETPSSSTSEGPAEPASQP